MHINMLKHMRTTSSNLLIVALPGLDCENWF